MLTRENLKSGILREMIRQADPTIEIWSDDRIRASLAATMADGPERDAIWVFGYGSLIWNPAFHYVETCKGRLPGYHREYCLWTRLGRGTIDNPGLTLGLEVGGECTGVAFRIDKDAAEEELEIIWRREMVAGAYVPTWVTITCCDGRYIPAIAFVIDHGFERYAGGLTEDEIVERIATARGPLGGCSDYLFNTVKHLDELGLPDPYLHRLADRVRVRMAPEAAQ